MRITNIAALLAFIASLNPAVAQHPSPLWGSLESGSYHVGFSVRLEHDSSRTMSGAPRPVQTSVWYPTNDSSDSMTYGNYVALTAHETESADPEDSVLARYKHMVISNGVPADAVDLWMVSPLVAHRDAHPAPGSFPLILIAQGNFHSAHHQAILAEYLASHGFVVATSPSQTRIGTPMNSEDDIIPNMKDQVADLQVVFSHLKARAYVNAARIAVIGHSFGGRSAVIFQAMVPEVQAIVSLDGGIGIEPTTALFSRYPGFRLVAVPILHCYETTDPFIKSDLTLLRSLNQSDRYLVHIPEFHHMDFSTLGMVAGVIPGFAAVGRDQIREKYETVCRLTLAFLQQAIKGPVRGSMLQSLVKHHGLSIERIAPTGTPDAESLVQTEKDFAALAVREGTKPAFLAFLADSGIVFRPHPVNGKTVIAGRPNPPIVLDWIPSRAEAAGDLGYTTGPWVLTFKGEKPKPPLFGNYLSVWKKDSTEHWKLILDVGTSNSQPEIPLQDAVTMFPAAVTGGSAGALVSLGSIDRALSALCQSRGMREAYAQYASADIRLMRDGCEPVTGDVGDSLSRWDEKPALDPIAEVRSSNGDLGYTYGRYTRGGSGNAERGYYVHLWRKSGRTYKLVVDLLSPLPEE